jgi:hypothetical protein
MAEKSWLCDCRGTEYIEKQWSTKSYKFRHIFLPSQTPFDRLLVLLGQLNAIIPYHLLSLAHL